MVGEYVKARLKGKGRVIVIEGIRGVENAELRKKGFIDAVTTDSKIKIVRSESANWHTDEAFSLASKLFQQHKSIDAIFCANDKMALGVLQALDLIDLAVKTIVAGYDNIESVRNEMRNNRVQATVEQHPELMGEYGVRLAWQALNGQQSPSVTQTPLDLITHESFNKKIALSVSSLDNSFFQFLLQGAQKAAELHGVALQFADAKNDDAKQLVDISKFIKEKVNLIIINPTNTEMISHGIEMANKKRIPIITVDRKSTGGNIVCHIASDNIEGGKMAARVLAKHIKSKGHVIELEGIPGTSAAHDRGAGFNEELRKYPGINVVAREAANFKRREAEQILMHILKEDKLEFDAVFAHNDNMILGVIDALEKKNLKKQPVLIGFDALPEALKAVAQGRLTATIAQQPETMGSLSVVTAVRYFRGEILPRTIDVDLSLISK
jgi:ABC-type sugar transport system substrate-binding protein